MLDAAAFKISHKIFKKSFSAATACQLRQGKVMALSLILMWGSWSRQVRYNPPAPRVTPKQTLVVVLIVEIEVALCFYYDYTAKHIAILGRYTAGVHGNFTNAATRN